MGKMPLWVMGTPGPLKTHWETAEQVLKEAVDLPITSWVCFGGGGSRITGDHRRESLTSLVVPSGRLQSMGSLKSDTAEQLHFHLSRSCIGEGNGNSLQCSCLENPREGGAWWAATYGIAQSRSRLKRLSSSSSGDRATQGIGSGAYQLFPNPPGTKSMDSIPGIQLV